MNVISPLVSACLAGLLQSHQPEPPPPPEPPPE